MIAAGVVLSGPVGQWIVGQVSGGAGKDASGDMTMWLGIGAGLLAAIGGLAYAVHRKLEQQRQNSHPALFYGLCRHHGLDGASGRLLRLVWQHHRLAQPARLFTEPKWTDPAYLSDTLRGRSAELAALRQLLFGISSPTK